ncbi:hypothetical protein E2C01_096640 [Portunus trituberculatus]|uniref:Uncharacterized protein n=1 Tax=Portunus trituberculatus TaxID=210409 RepID=A0A5B7K2J5_PORTR|nr:hypothetical protein [Portunus trituberculatus]
MAGRRSHLNYGRPFNGVGGKVTNVLSVIRIRLTDSADKRGSASKYGE